MPILQTVIENYSRYPIDIVWENAQDLEHVAFLHRKTNHSFEVVHVERHPLSTRAYDTMIYRSIRRLGPFLVKTHGFRRIISDYRLHQIESLPWIGVTSALSSNLVPTGDPRFPTLLRDEVVMEIPRLLYWARHRIVASLARHARIQCEEDEPYRERRQTLRERGIRMPYRLFFETSYERLSRHFEGSPS
jgi:hypothetical protein